MSVRVRLEARQQPAAHADESFRREGDGFLIVGGAEKAGTTSVYAYLAAHPEVCPSLAKETDYFRGSDVSLAGYLSCFPPMAPGQSLRLESSPGYLAEAETSAPAIARVLPGARLVFVLRDPIERLKSCHRFYLSRLSLPKDMTLDGFARLCITYTEDPSEARRSGVKDWHLNALARGKYETALQAFRNAMPDSRILLVDFRDLARSPGGTMKRIASFSGIDSSFYDTYGFARENVSFAARSRALQGVAVEVNDRLEWLWRRHPRLKRGLLTIYKTFNAADRGPDDFSPSTLSRLHAFYSPTFAFMADSARWATQDSEHRSDA